MAASSPSNSQPPWNFPSLDSLLEFTPQSSQDTELLKALSFVPGLQEILMVRQVHALEHATVWVLSESCPERSLPYRISPTQVQPSAASLGGMSTSEGFYLYGTVSRIRLNRAVHTALQRLTTGEWNLAVHPRCGTNLSVGMMLTAGLGLGLHWILPRGPIEQLLGMGVAATVAAQLAPEVGEIVQRYVTTAIPFNLAIVDIVPKGQQQGYPVHFVRVKWVG